MGQNNGKNDLKELSEKLRYYREASALSHQQVANALGIDRSTYTKYENGDIRLSARMLSRFSLSICLA